jgi:hypothetical protein
MLLQPRLRKIRPNMKKVSDVFKSIRFAKGETRGKKHSSTDDEEHGTVGEMEFDQQLAHAKKRAMQEAKDPGEYDQEGDMAMTQLRSIIYHAQELHDQLDKNDNLPEWVQSKITLAQDYMQTACDYMYSQKNEEVVQEKRGLWDNIHAKRERIKNGSGERMRKPGSEGAPSAEDLKNSRVKEEVELQEEKQQHTHVTTQDLDFSGHGATHIVKKGSHMRYVEGSRQMFVHLKGGKPVRKTHPFLVIPHEFLKRVNEEVEHIEEGRQSQRHPLEGHEYHKKTDAELVHIAKDAHKAAEAMKSHNTTAENKYRDQANDSATVRYYRQKNGMADWYKKKYGHIKESDASWAAAMEKQRENRLTTGDKKKLDQVRDMLAKEKKPVKKEVMESVKVGDKVSFNHPMTAIPGKTMKKVGTIKKIEGDTVHLKSSTKYGTISYQKKVSELTKEEVVKEEVKDEYARKVDKYLKKKHGKDDSQKKLPMGAGFAAARRKARLASNGRMDEALSPAIRMQMALQKAREDRERSERNGEAALAGKFSSGPAKQPTKNHTLVSPKNEEVIVEDDVINKVPKLPFDEPTKKAIGKVKDKSGAVHTPMSRTRDIARTAARKQAGIKEAADVNDPLDKIDTSAKRSLSRTAGMVKDLATKAKAKSKDKKDTFEAEPELSSQIMKQE